MILVFLFLFLVAIVMKVIVQTSKYPEKGVWVAVLDTMFIPLRFLRIGPFKDGKISLDAVMKSVMKETKLSDFGDLSFVDSFKVITESALQKSLTFSNIGYIMAFAECTTNLTRRVQLIEYVKKAPEVLNIPIKSPVFVFGLGRSGTTLIHRLLSLDPAVRSPKLWELMMPVPGVHCTGSKEPFIEDSKRRAAIVKGKIKMRDFLGDKTLEKFHEIDSELPEECLHVMADEIPCSTHNLYTCLGAAKLYIHGVSQTAVLKAYQWHKKVLQTLSYQIGDKDNKYRWVLKSPLHVLHIKQIKQVYPDAKLIWAHRHPIPTVTSLCALARAIHGLYYDKETCDEKALGRSVSAFASHAVHTAVQDIASTGLPCFHMRFDRLVSDPIQVVREIYGQYGWEFTAEYESILIEYLKNDALKRSNIAKKNAKSAPSKVTPTSSSDKNQTKKTHKLHHHNPAEFSLTREELMVGNFKEYIELFNLVETD